MLNILYVSGGYQIFQISPRIKSLYDRCRKRIYLLTGESISRNLSTGEATGVHLTGALGQELIQVNVSRYERCGVNSHFSTGQNLLKNMLRKDNHLTHNQLRKAF